MRVTLTYDRLTSDTHPRSGGETAERPPVLFSRRTFIKEALGARSSVTRHLRIATVKLTCYPGDAYCCYRELNARRRCAIDAPQSPKADHPSSPSSPPPCPPYTIIGPLSIAPAHETWSHAQPTTRGVPLLHLIQPVLEPRWLSAACRVPLRRLVLRGSTGSLAYQHILGDQHQATQPTLDPAFSCRRTDNQHSGAHRRNVLDGTGLVRCTQMMGKVTLRQRRAVHLIGDPRSRQLSSTDPSKPSSAMRTGLSQSHTPTPTPRCALRDPVPIGVHTSLWSFGHLGGE